MRFKENRKFNANCLRLSSKIFVIIVSIAFFDALNCLGASLRWADKIIIEGMVKDWSEAHNHWDLEKFSLMYADDVYFYCQQLSKQKCISLKSTLLKPNEIFNQKIISKIEYYQYSNGVTLVSFTKKVKTKRLTKEYPSYLLFYKQNGKLLIVGEGDRITDKNLKIKLNVNTITLPKDDIKIDLKKKNLHRQVQDLFNKLN